MTCHVNGLVGMYQLYVMFHHSSTSLEWNYISSRGFSALDEARHRSKSLKIGGYACHHAITQSSTKHLHGSCTMLWNDLFKAILQDLCPVYSNWRVHVYIDAVLSVSRYSYQNSNIEGIHFPGIICCFLQFNIPANPALTWCTT